MPICVFKLLSCFLFTLILSQYWF